MNTGAFEEKVLKVVARHYKVSVDSLTRESRFDQDLKGDSLRYVELIMALEEELGLVLPDTEAGRSRNVGELLDLVSRHQS
jgi:acyl carrier protein